MNEPRPAVSTPSAPRISVRSASSVRMVKTSCSAKQLPADNGRILRNVMPAFAKTASSEPADVIADPSPGCGPAASSRACRDEPSPPGRAGRRPLIRRWLRSALGSRRMRAANTTRSGQSSRGLGLDGGSVVCAWTLARPAGHPEDFGASTHPFGGPPRDLWIAIAIALRRVLPCGVRRGLFRAARRSSRRRSGSRLGQLLARDRPDRLRDQRAIRGPAAA
jgi:hypothetical protein